MSRVVRQLAVIALMLGFAHSAMAQTTVRYIHTDALGSMVAMTDEGRVVVERREYEPYGQQLTAMEDGPGYTGHVQDAASGLTYMQQRYYDPAIALFLSVDPVTAIAGGDLRQLNRYVYAYNNPYLFTDPDGRNPFATTCTSNAQNAVLCGSGVGAPAAGGSGGAATTTGGVLEVVVGTRILNEANQGGPEEPARSPEEVSQEAIDRIKHGTKPAEGQPGRDGVLEGAGGKEGVEIAKEIARSADGSTEKTYPNGTTVITLPDGRKVEAHTSTKGGQYKGSPTVKIQEKDGTVRPENIIRYPER